MIKPYIFTIIADENETYYTRNKLTEPLHRKLKKKYGNNVIINISDELTRNFVTIKQGGKNVIKSIINEFSKLLNLPAGNYEIGYVKDDDAKEYNIIFLPEGKYTICEEIREDIIANLVNC